MDRSLLSLLIEPFGIETQFSEKTFSILQPLLIEPFGIETRHDQRGRTNHLQLLIEPFGIETKKALQRGQDEQSFNRTFWN